MTLPLRDLNPGALSISYAVPGDVSLAAFASARDKRFGRGEGFLPQLPVAMLTFALSVLVLLGGILTPPAQQWYFGGQLTRLETSTAHISDPLTANTLQWAATSPDAGKGFAFTPQGYVYLSTTCCDASSLIAQPMNNGLVEVTVHQQVNFRLNEAGIVFRANSDSNTMLAFTITPSGEWHLNLLPKQGDGPESDYQELRYEGIFGGIAAIHQGLDATNRLAVLMQGSTFTFFANGQYLGRYQSNDVPQSGQVGVYVGRIRAALSRSLTCSSRPHRKAAHSMNTQTPESRVSDHAPMRLVYPTDIVGKALTYSLNEPVEPQRQNIFADAIGQQGVEAGWWIAALCILMLTLINLIIGWYTEDSLNWSWYWSFAIDALLAQVFILWGIWYTRREARARPDGVKTATQVSVRSLRRAALAGDDNLAPPVTDLIETPAAPPPNATLSAFTVLPPEWRLLRRLKIGIGICIGICVLTGVAQLVVYAGGGTLSLVLLGFVLPSLILCLWQFVPIVRRSRSFSVDARADGLHWQKHALPWSEVRGWFVFSLQLQTCALDTSQYHLCPGWPARKPHLAYLSSRN